MKKLLFTFSLVMTTCLLFAQTWQNIGTTIGTAPIHQDIAIDPITGELYVAYVENSTQRANVRKWNGTSWVTVGNTNFGQGSSMVDIKIAVRDGAIYVAPKFLVSGLYYIRGYYLNGATWSTMGSMNYQTPLSYPYSLKVSSNDNVYLSFFNQTSLIGDTDLITLGLSTTSEGQFGGEVSDSYAGDHDFVIDDNEEYWVANEYGDMSNYVNVSYSGFPFYTVQNVAVNDWSGKIVMNLADGSVDARIGSYVDDAYLGLVRYNLTNGISTSIITMYNSTVTDYDMASTSTHDYFLYSIGGTHYIESINMANTQTTLGTNVFGGTGNVLDPRIEEWNGRLVISCIRGGVVRVMELDNPSTVTLGNTFGGCEQTLMTAPTVSLTVDDNNYSHATLSVTVNSTDIVTVPNANVNLVGSYPNYYLQFTSTNIASDVNMEFEFETIENGSSTNYVLFYADVIAQPTVSVSLPSSEVCKNQGLVNLLPHGTPLGGFWSGTGVNTATGKFNPGAAPVGTHVLTYTYNNSFGCSASATATLTVNPVASVTVSTTAATCGAEDGTINATITGGTPSYTIYWSNGANTEDQTDLAPGSYMMNVTDSKGCLTTKLASVSSNGVTISDAVTNVLCPNGNTGAIDLTVTAGSGVQSILWSTGATTEDVSGLTAGTYDVTVTANDGCVSTSTVTVGGPDPLTFVGSTTPASCATANGSATCNVSGGTAPYDFQWFSAISGTPVGTNSATISGFAGGGYYAIVTDDNGCVGIHNAMITETGGPEVLIASVIPAGCTDDGSIDISVITDEPIASYEWSNGLTTEDISSLPAGFYTVEVIDQSGCVGMGGIEVPSATPDVMPICLVTVDTLTNTNLLVWEKPISADIDYFNIYRETSVAGEFLFVASVDYDDESVYNDLVASPQVRSWRYKLTAVNMCGEESDFSEFHKTIHLTINLGLGGLINLNWDNYEGFNVGTFDLYRTVNGNSWVLLQSMPSNLFSYSDTPPTINGLDYIISVAPPATCTSTNKAQDHNSSRSNKTSSITGDLVGLDESDASGLTQVYPNPSNGLFNVFVNTENFDNAVIRIFDVNGNVIQELYIDSELTIIDLSSYADGVYTMQVIADNQTVNRKLIKQ